MRTSKLTWLGGRAGFTADVHSLCLSGVEGLCAETVVQDACYVHLERSYTIADVPVLGLLSYQTRHIFPAHVEHRRKIYNGEGHCVAEHQTRAPNAATRTLFSDHHQGWVVAMNIWGSNNEN